MITLNSVTKKFGAFTAVDNISYTIGKGEYFALLGPNGAGKTTIVRMFLDFIKPTSGSIAIDSHLLSEVEKTCETTAIMHKGKILVKDSIHSILKNGETLEDVFIRYVERENG